ncbi:MAG TPA: flagellar M-ring protein FliF, partial [Holosporales bacterium]|nr:flagellar M-ring protein FliF [Holosporales bacterium]
MELLRDIFKKLGVVKTASILGGVGMVLASLFFFVTNVQAPDMGILYSDLEPGDAAKIVDRLKSTNTPVELNNNGMQILVPRDKIAELRMEFASDGLLTGGSVGYELFDKADLLGTSSAVLDINHLRAIEGEIAKSIKSINTVQSARVHLVVPKRELFSRTQSQPSASIVLKMKGNNRLSANQIQAVQALVSMAVLNMTNDRISIIDDKGTLLSRGRDSSASGDSVSVYTTMKEEYEEKISRQIEQLLERTLGPDQVRVEIAADMDFDKITTQSVDYDPDGQVLKSVTSSEEGSNSNELNGDAVSIQNAIPNQEHMVSGGATNKNASTKTEESKAYEISNKTITTVKEIGGIKHLSVAVLVNGSYKKNEQGKVEYIPRSDDEMNKITELVKTAVGYKKERNDSIQIVNLKFSTPPEEIKILEPSTIDEILNSIDFRKLIELTIIGLFLLIIILRFIKPILVNLMSHGTRIPISNRT